MCLQDRVGGRILSLPFGGNGGVAELGAQFIWGSESGMDASSQAGSSGGGRGNPITEVSLAELGKGRQCRYAERLGVGSMGWGWLTDWTELPPALQQQSHCMHPCTACRAPTCLAWRA